MERKKCEAVWAAICAKRNIWNHKFTDVMNCPTCHRPIFMTKHTDNRDKDGSESIVDYFAFTGENFIWVECKQAETAFSFKDINPKQRGFLDSWEQRGVNTYLFLFMSPESRVSSAFLIPWREWKKLEEEMVSAGRLSIPYTENQLKSSRVYNACTTLQPFALNYVRGEGWKFPPDHPFLKENPTVGFLPPLYQKEETHEAN